MRLMAPSVVLCAAIAACSPKSPENGASMEAPAPAARAVHPESGLEVMPLAVIGDEENRHEFRVEVARTSLEQARGLMFRTEMAPDEGMLFPLSPPREASFWMKNTVIPLDIIFIGPDRRILNIEANAVPYSLEPRLSEGAAVAVLELNAGRAAALGIGPGDKVEW